MDESLDPPFEPAVLLEHAGFVRAVARAVLRGDAEVEDVVQDTWVAAMGRSPRERGALRGWLAAIARNRALQVLRSGRRRATRELRAARSEATPSAADIAEREETRRRLVHALLAEAEPYRTALVLRYHQDLPPREIARRLGIPVETVKTRVKRGLARMRARLDGAEARDRRSWRAALAPLAGTGEVLGWGGTVMSTPKVAAAVGAVVVVGLAAWVATRPATERPEAPRPSPATARVDEERSPPSLAGAARDEGVPAARGAAAATAPALAGVVVDDGGQPVDGTLVAGLAPDAPPLAAMKQTAPEPDPAAMRVLARSDHEGRFSLNAPPSDVARLAFLCEGHEIEEVLLPTEDARELRVVLTRGRKVTGRVVDGEGRPVATATVQAHARSGRRWTSFRTETDAAGRFALRYLPRRFRLDVDAAGYMGVDLDEGEPPEPVELRLQRSRLIVEAVAAETGERLPEASAVLVLAAAASHPVGLSPRLSPKSSPPTGELALDLETLLGSVERWTGKRDSIAGDLHVFAPGRTSVRVPLSWTAETEPPHLRVDLPRGAGAVALAGRIEGSPKARVEVRAPPPPDGIRNYDDEHLALLAAGDTGDGGAFELRGLPPGRYRLVVRAEGSSPQSLDVSAPATDLVVALAVGGSLEVRAATRSGRPAADVWIHVQPDAGPRHWNERTGPDGRAVFRDLPTGRVQVAARGGRSASRMTMWTAATARVTADVTAGRTTTVDVVAPERVPFTFVVRDDAARGVEGAQLRLEVHPDSHAESVEGEWNRVVDLKLRTGRDGRATTALFPGPYHTKVTVGRTERTAWAHVPMTDDGALEVVLPSPSRVLRGRVVDASTGAGVAGRPVYVREAALTSAEQIQGVSDDTGAFEIAGVPAGLLHVDVAPNLAPNRSPFDGNVYAGGYVEVDAASTETTPVTIRLPRTTGEGAVAATVEAELVLTDAGTGKPVPGASAFAHALREGTWVHAGGGALGEDGKPQRPVRLLAADEYRVTVSGPLGVDPPYQRQEVSLLPERGVLRVEVALRR